MSWLLRGSVLVEAAVVPVALAGAGVPAVRLTEVIAVTASSLLVVGLGAPNTRSVGGAHSGAVVVDRRLLGAGRAREMF